MVASAAGAATAAPPLTPATAQPWVASWERAQDRAVAARQERSSAVVALVDREVARAATRCAVPVVLELGAGTGTLARRIAQRSPGARVVALEDDPVLLAMARAVCAGDPGVEVVAGSVGAPGWLERLGHVDVVVASGVLHRLRPSALATLYRELAGTLPAGGVLVDADELLRSTRSAAVRRPGGADPADEWWRAAARAPELVGAFAARGVAAAQRDHDNLLSAPEHSRVLLDLGFGRAHEVWRSGPSAVLAAWR